MKLYIKAVIGFLIHMISPLVLIWSLNTLFNVGIPFSFKTWFAGMLLIFLIRHHLSARSTYRPSYVHDFDDFDDYDEEDEEELEEYTKPKGKKEKEELSKIVLEKIARREGGQEPEPKGRKRGGK